MRQRIETELEPGGARRGRTEPEPADPLDTLDEMRERSNYPIAGLTSHD